MNLSRYLVLHKTEWDRLKRKQSHEKKYSEKEEYIRSLNEQSQNWIKKWPDTVEGHVYQLKKQKEIDHAKLIETVKQFASKKKQEENLECIKKAKELIFETSCFGQQLKSALLESKTLEERDAQVKFQKQLREEAALQKKLEPKSTSLQNFYEMEQKEKTIEICKKQRDLETVQIDKAMFELNAKKKKEIIKEEFDEWLNQKLKEKETQIKNTRAMTEKEELKEYEVHKKKIEELKALREKEEDIKIKIWQDYQDRVKSRQKNIFKQMHYNKTNTPQYQKIYENIKHLSDDKNKRYDDFVQKGIERWLERSKVPKEIETKAIERNKRKVLDEENKILSEVNRQINTKENQKCLCYRQSFIGKCCIKPKTKDKQHLSFLKPKNKLLEDLKKREQDSSWKFVKAAHAFFAQRANDTLRECRYKKGAQKVVDDYRRINNLDEKLLPIPEY